MLGVSLSGGILELFVEVKELVGRDEFDGKSWVLYLLHGIGHIGEALIDSVLGVVIVRSHS